MRIKSLIMASALAVSVLGGAAPALASQDIPWTWNSGDHDSQATFQAYGEHIYAYEYNGNNYVDYTFPGVSSRWFITGNDTKTRQDLNLSIAEGKSVSMKVCQDHTAFPDDCSATRYGVS
jgi:hypothetical protein